MGRYNQDKYLVTLRFAIWAAYPTVCMQEIRSIRLVWPLLKIHGWALLASIILGLLSFVAEGVGIGMFIPLLDSLAPGNFSSNVLLGSLLSSLPVQHRATYVVLFMMLLMTGKGILMYAYDVLGASITSKTAHVIRSRVFWRILSIDHAVLDHTESGRLINLLGTETWRASDAVSLAITIMINLCAIAVFGCMLLLLSWKLTLVVAAGIVLISVLLQLFNGRAHQLGRRCIEENAVLGEQMIDGLEGVKVIQSFGMEGARKRMFDAISGKVRTLYFRLDMINRAVNPISEVLYLSVLLAAFMIGLKSYYSVSSMLVFILVLYRLQPRISSLSASRLALVTLTSAVEDVMRFVTAPQTDHFAGPDIEGPQREVTFHNVSFRYNEEREHALTHISFRIPHGCTTAVVGGSGAGKSTLISLLCGFRSPTAGEIRVDGVPLSEIGRGNWLRKIGFAGQESYVFNGTVRENIACGCPDARDEDVAQAAVSADADSFIRVLPQGFETKIGNGGAPLSGGQRQRLALARAFLRNPKILIFDEATSALDSLTEGRIQQALGVMQRDRTIIVISHRLSTIKHADHIVVLESGRVAMEGPPKKLFSEPGFLATIHQLQHFSKVHSLE